MPLPWPQYLSALEAWLQHTEAAVRGGDVPVDPFGEEPDGPLPPEHALRARALLDAMQRVQQTGARRRADLERAQTYERD